VEIIKFIHLHLMDVLLLQILATPANNKVDYLVIAGGAGAGNWAGGGGGAGGYRESKCACVSGCWTASPLATPVSLPVSSTTYPVIVGAGGAGQPAGTNWPSTQACNGSNSVFSTITSTGGGYGGSNDRPPNMSGGPGGSGGGASRCISGVAGSGNTPPVSPPQGNNGGTGTENGPTGYLVAVAVELVQLEMMLQILLAVMEEQEQLLQ
jgi:hypothetical protein